MSEELKKEFKKDGYLIWEAKGCGKCMHKGTKGRMAIYEALEITPEMKRIIIEGVTEEKIIQESIRQGMITMKQDGIMKVLQGLTPLEEVLQSTM